MYSNISSLDAGSKQTDVIKIETAFKCVFEETVPKLSVNFGNHNSQDSHKKQHPSLVLNFGFTEPQYSDKF